MVIVISVNGMVDHTTPSGWKSLMDQLVAAEGYSRNLSQVMKDTRLSEAEEGRLICQPGILDRGRFLFDHRADQQRLLFRLIRCGEHSATSLFVTMNALGYRAWSERKHCEILYSKWNILEMLRNPFYIGKIRINGTLHDGNHQPLIDRETWE